MGEAQRLLNIDGIASSLKLKFDGTPVGEVLGKHLALCAVVGRGQSYRQLDADDVLRVAAHSLNFIGNGKQRQNPESVVLRFVPVIRDTFLRKSIVFPLVFQRLAAKGRYVALLQAGCKRSVMQNFDQLIPMIHGY